MLQCASRITVRAPGEEVLPEEEHFKLHPMQVRPPRGGDAGSRRWCPSPAAPYHLPGRMCHRF